MSGPLKRSAVVGIRSSERISQRFAVPFEYDVHFTSDVFDGGNPTLAEAISRREPSRRHRIFVVVDGGVACAEPGVSEKIVEYAGVHSRALELAGRVEVFSGGEQVKNDPQAVEALLRHAFRLGLDRQSFFVVVGGGALQDMAGYAAAICHRGIRLVRVPTTVQSQNDSGVGVKSGINYFGLKNFLGAFAPPFAVVNDYCFIETLPTRERVSGMAEAVKVALIRDADFFRWLADNSEGLAAFDPTPMQTMIRRSAELHLRHIGTCGDPFESSNVRPLDFGHWAAHKLESLSGYECRHGEAVAIGIALDAHYSVAAGLLGESALEDICVLLEALGFELWRDELLQRDARGRLALLNGLVEFRRHIGGEFSVTLLGGIGVGVDVDKLDEAMVENSLGWLANRSKRRRSPAQSGLRHVRR